MQVRFDNPKWSIPSLVFGMKTIRFTKEGANLVMSALKKTGNRCSLQDASIDGTYAYLIYDGQWMIEPSLICHVRQDLTLSISVSTTKYHNNILIKHEITPSEIKFLDRLARNLSKALSQEEPIGPPTKPIIPPGTMFERLPFEVEELIREFAIEPKNPFL